MESHPLMYAINWTKYYNLKVENKSECKQNAMTLIIVNLCEKNKVIVSKSTN